MNISDLNNTITDQTLIHDYQRLRLKNIKPDLIQQIEFETKRISIFNHTNILSWNQQNYDNIDSEEINQQNEIQSSLNNFTNLCIEIFHVPIAVISFIDIDLVLTKSIAYENNIDIDITKLNMEDRNNSCHSYTILPNTHDVLIFNNISKDERFQNNKIKCGDQYIEYYAGVAITINQIKIGTLSLLDTNANKKLDLEAQENLLDLAAAISFLLEEYYQFKLDISTEKANLIVNMMHNLRTPMTAMNCACSILLKETKTFMNKTQAMIQDTTNTSHITAQDTLIKSKDLIEEYQLYMDDINMSINHMDNLVFSTFQIGQALVNSKEDWSDLAKLFNYEIHKSKLVEFNILSCLEEIYQSFLESKKLPVNITWEIDPTFLELTKSQVSYPDLIRLIIIFVISQFSIEWSKIKIICSYEPLTLDDAEYPEMFDRMREGQFILKVIPLENRLDVTCSNNNSNNNTTATNIAALVAKRNSFLRGSFDKECKSDAETMMKMCSPFASLEKVLHLYKGGYRVSKETIELQQSNNTNNNKNNSNHPTKINTATSNTTTINDNNNNSISNNHNNEELNIYLFWLPCTILFAESSILQSTYDIEILINIDISDKINNAMTHKSPSIIYNLIASPLIDKEKLNQIFLIENNNQPPSINQEKTNTKIKKEIRCSADLLNLFKTSGIDKITSELIQQVAPTHEIIKPFHNNATTTSHSNTTSMIVSKDQEISALPSIVIKKLHVLIIEDTLSVQKLLCRWFQRNGCLVTCAVNGKIGLNDLITKKIDIAIVDFLMPVMLGCTTMKLFQEWLQDEIKIIPTNPIAVYNQNILILGMSATASETEQDEAFRYGMHFFCPKPTNMDLLSLIVKIKQCTSSNELVCDILCDEAESLQALKKENHTTNTNNNSNNDNNNMNDLKANDKSSDQIKNDWSLFRSFKQAKTLFKNNKVLPVNNLSDVLVENN